MATVVGGGNRTERHGQQALTLAVLSCRLPWLRGARVVRQRPAADGTSAHRLLRWVPGQLLGVPLGQGRLEGLVVTVLQASWARQWRVRHSTLLPSTAGWRENWGWVRSGSPRGVCPGLRHLRPRTPRDLQTGVQAPSFLFFSLKEHLSERLQGARHHARSFPWSPCIHLPRGRHHRH